MAKPKSLTIVEETFVMLFAQREGRNWKAKLREVWETGKVDEHEQALYQLRNTHGPSWLDSYKLQLDWND